MTARCIKSKKFCRNKHDRGLILLSAILTFSVIGLFFFYLIQVNSLVSCNFKIRDYQEKAEVLKTSAEMMEMDIAQWQSPANLEGLVNSLEMIEIGEVTYLENEQEMAIKK